MNYLDVDIFFNIQGATIKLVLPLLHACSRGDESSIVASCNVFANTNRGQGTEGAIKKLR